MVKLTAREWSSIVRFFRSEERIMVDSYGIPGRKRSTWKEFFRKGAPKSFEVYEGARRVIERK